jgi:hypothetical protein
MLSTLTTSRIRWPFLLCALLALGCLLAPTGAGAKVRMLGPGDGEGDPTDSNDLGDSGSGGGTDDDMHDGLATTPPVGGSEEFFVFGALRIVILPSALGVLPFEVLIIRNAVPEDVYAR